MKVKLLNKISAIATDILAQNGIGYGEDVENSDAILVRSASMHETELPASVKAIARAGAGVNNIPIPNCSEKGVVVFNTPGANANAVKELVILGLLLSSRKVPASMDWVKTLKGKGGDVAALVEKGKGAFVGPELYGKSLGILGLGAIGVLVANTALHLGMKVYGYDPYISVDTAWKLSRQVIKADSLQQIYENCDYITIHTPLTPETKGMVNSTSIESMKDGVRILNFARGELVDNADMLEAVAKGKVAGYVIDFPADELIGVENIIAIPHLGASTPESEDNCAEMASNQLVDYLQNGNITNSVNMPNVTMEKTGAMRVGVIHRNVPAILNQITGAFGSAGVNIENMINKSKKDYAYTLVDIDSKIGEDKIAALGSIEGVVRVNCF